MTQYEELCRAWGKKAKAASYVLQEASEEIKNKAMLLMAEELLAHSDEILQANKIDQEEALKNGMPNKMMDRLLLTKERIVQMAEGLEQVHSLPDPIGEVLSEVTRPNGMVIKKVRVPLGVIAIIYEARPNVTVDATGLCIKTGNAVILRGGKEAFHTNQKMVTVLQGALEKAGLPKECVQLVTTVDRELVPVLLKQRDFIDVVIPRGGAGLIKKVVETSMIPVIETGSGVCHVYIDKDADLQKAIPILLNAKVQRPSVCNSCETVLIHKDLLPRLDTIMDALARENVSIIGDETICERVKGAEAATKESWHTEYNDFIINAKVVSSLDEAIHHINQYGTKHSECIVTEDGERANRFMKAIDAAAVYHNVSTRFTDGFEFGFGAEIGISTQKLHARGPMGLPELTSYKYIITGTGQVR